MNPVVWVVVAGVIAVAIIIITASLTSSSSRKSEQQLAAMRQEMQTSLTTQSQGISSQLNHVVQNVTQQLGQVRQELQAGVASTGQLTSDAQREVARRLQASTDLLVEMSQKIGEVRQTGQDLSKAAQSLQSVLGGAKTRGTLGEVTLERLLADALPQSAFETQFRFDSTGAVVDAIVRIGNRILPIDSKFPLEAYRRLADGGDEARRDFCVAVRKHATSIAEKYVLPHEHTFDYALMFVPSESVYYELLMSEDSKHGPLDEFCRAQRVFPASPNTICALLGAVAINLQERKLEENIQYLRSGLDGLKKQMESFADVYEKLGNHLRHAQQSYDEADSKFERARNSLEQVSQGVFPEKPAPKILDAGSAEPARTEPLFAGENYKAD
ncbi:MAG TPA: DNA recombination protein RmuC [Candidatus Acidoferrum sp.]|nr:DNA recombination protein RmuC [Candidatus Acidoferrum sp.]